MPRTARIDSPGLVHHVRVRGVEKRKIFLNDFDRREFLERLDGQCEDNGSVIYAWSLMSNHFHLAIRTGHKPLSKTMSGLLTGYAMGFNRRHNRSGHLFQNRYKSTVVEEERYLLALVRYIHRNPMEARMVSDMSGLGLYPWTGHCALMKGKKRDFQDVAFILGQFAKTTATARKRLAAFMVEKNASQDGKVFTGGGLVRSAGGMERLKEIEQDGERWMHDERILGSSSFVEQVVKQNEQVEGPIGYIESQKWELFDKVQTMLCERYDVSPAEICGPGRVRTISTVRRLLWYCGQKQLGLSSAQIARYFGVSGQSVLQGAAKCEKEWESLEWLLEDIS